MRYHSVGIAAQISGEREKAPHDVARARAITRRYPVRVLPAEYPEVLWFIKLKEGLSLSQLSYKSGVVYVQFTVSCEIGCLIVTHFPHKDAYSQSRLWLCGCFFEVLHTLGEGALATPPLAWVRYTEQQPPRIHCLLGHPRVNHQKQ